MHVRYDVTELGTLGGPKSVAVALNDHGHVVGQADTDRKRDAKMVRDAFLWRGGRLRDIGRFTAAAVNDSGDVVGHRNQDSNTTAVVCQGQKIKPILSISHTASIAYAINNDEQVVGWSYTAGNVNNDFGRESRWLCQAKILGW